MAAKKEETFDNLTVVAEEKKPSYTGPMVSVYLPPLEDPGDQGIKVDQYEHVTIANENKEECWRVLRGVRVDVPVPVYILLKDRYPNI